MNRCFYGHLLRMFKKYPIIPFNSIVITTDLIHSNWAMQHSFSWRRVVRVAQRHCILYLSDFLWVYKAEVREKKKIQETDSSHLEEVLIPWVRQRWWVWEEKLEPGGTPRSILVLCCSSPVELQWYTLWIHLEIWNRGDSFLPSFHSLLGPRRALGPRLSLCLGGYHGQ